MFDFVIFSILQVLERLFLDGPSTPHEAKALSTETLLDILLILYNECCNSSLRKEKTLTDFIELGRTRARHYTDTDENQITYKTCLICINMQVPSSLLCSQASHIVVYPLHLTPHDNDIG